MGYRPMSSVVCPRCAQHEVDCLEEISSRSHVDYLRCRSCAEVWTVPRAPAEAPCDTASSKTV